MFSVITASKLTQTLSLTYLNFSTTFAQCVAFFYTFLEFWSDGDRVVRQPITEKDKSIYLKGGKELQKLIERVRQESGLEFDSGDDDDEDVDDNVDADASSGFEDDEDEDMAHVSETNQNEQVEDEEEESEDEEEELVAPVFVENAGMIHANEEQDESIPEEDLEEATEEDEDEMEEVGSLLNNSEIGPLQPRYDSKI